MAVETPSRVWLNEADTVATQFAPNPDFPTVTLPKPLRGAREPLTHVSPWLPTWTPTSKTALIPMRIRRGRDTHGCRDGGCCPVTKPAG